MRHELDRKIMLWHLTNQSKISPIFRSPTLHPSHSPHLPFFFLISPPPDPSLTGEPFVGLLEPRGWIGIRFVHCFAGQRFWLRRSPERNLSYGPDLKTFAEKAQANVVEKQTNKYESSLKQTSMKQVWSKQTNIHLICKSRSFRSLLRTTSGSPHIPRIWFFIIFNLFLSLHHPITILVVIRSYSSS